MTQTQTSTISDDNCSEQEYYQRDIRVVCACKGWAYATRDALVRNGWIFGLETRCPKCNTQIKAFCDLCNNESNGKKYELVKRGWGLGREQFCPACND